MSNDQAGVEELEDMVDAYAKDAGFYGPGAVVDAFAALADASAEDKARIAKVYGFDAVELEQIIITSAGFLQFEGGDKDAAARARVQLTELAVMTQDTEGDGDRQH